MYGCSNVYPYQLLTSLILGRWSLADSSKPREEPSAGKPLARICEGEAEWLNYSTTTNFETVGQSRMESGSLPAP